LTEKLSKKVDDEDDEEQIEAKMNCMLLLMKKLWNGVCQFIFGASAIDVLVESDRYFELLKEFDGRIERLKRDIANDLFQKKLHDIKTKFSAILTIFDKVINGKDSFITRKKRLDSLFYHCEEIIILVTDVESVIFEKAHYCIDFVSNFLVFHLGMLQIAEDDFGLKDYAERRTNALSFYPTLIKSYIDKAISTYVRSIILKYHNENARFKEFEEIYNEMNCGTIYKVNNTNLHPIWDGATVKEMQKDKMFYNFKDKKLTPLKPAFLCNMDTPLLCRALRNGLALKLVDLFSDYTKSITMHISLLGRTNVKKGGLDPEDFIHESNDEINSSMSTICSIKDQDKAISASQKYHEERMAKVDDLDDLCAKTKDLAYAELKSLDAVYSKAVEEQLNTQGVTEKQKIKLKTEFVSSIQESDSKIINLNKYLCFSVENQRFFNVSF
jgi:uncharacterized protein YdcH (DUF465 family)